MLDYLNWGLGILGGWMNSSIASMPSTPITVGAGPLAAVASVMGYASYFLPIHEAVTFLTGLAGAIGVWYIVRIAARWLKAAAD